MNDEMKKEVCIKEVLEKVWKWSFLSFVFFSLTSVLIEVMLLLEGEVSLDLIKEPLNFYSFLISLPFALCCISFTQLIVLFIVRIFYRGNKIIIEEDFSEALFCFAWVVSLILTWVFFKVWNL